MLKGTPCLWCAAQSATREHSGLEGPDERRPPHGRRPEITGKGNLFVIFGEPDIDILPAENGQVKVKINGVDSMDLVSVERDFQKKVCAQVRVVREGVDRYPVLNPFLFDDGDHLPMVMNDLDESDLQNLSGSWEEIWRSLESIQFLDLEQVLRYTELLGNATTAARVGFFLEQ